MSYEPQLRFEQKGSTGGVIFDADVGIAEISELRMYNVVLFPLLQGLSTSPSVSSSRRTPGSRQRDREESPTLHPGFIIGPNYPIPLFWHQYANHQHPERNAGSHGRLECVENTSSKISLEIESGSRSREVVSRYQLALTYSDELGSYVFDIQCRLDVPEGKQWLVTHNPSHGELEFCNLWPEGTFRTNDSDPSSRRTPGSREEAKRYRACYVQKADAVESIPHHHLESSDKHDIGMGPGDRFLWLLEDENPVVEICSSKPVSAGLCAYMWDAHFAYRVCDDGKDVHLPSGSSYEAHYKLYAVGRAEGERIVAAATPRPAPEIESIPVYVEGVNGFGETLSAATLEFRPGFAFGYAGQALRGNQGMDQDRGDIVPHNAWPWEHDTPIPGVIEYALDRSEGHSDDASVRIQATSPATGRWKATTLGPAFGEPPFEPGKRYRLTAFVKSRGLIGTARIGLRLHRTGIGDVFDLASYETFYSTDEVSGSTDWTRIQMTTPLIDPAPDRMHLLLEMEGKGTCWFDDVLFERNV